MKKLVYTTIAAAALSLGTSVAYAQFGGSIGSGNINGSSTHITGNIGASYDGGAYSGLRGTSGVGTDLSTTNGVVSSQALAVGGSLVGTTAESNLTDLANPIHTSESYQFGGNYETATASAPSIGGVFSTGEATVGAVSTQSFWTGGSTNFDAGFGLGFDHTNFDIDASWRVFNF